MDYDDNESASQNTQLGSEDSNKFPSGLHSYALPKFDLDEHFQVHVGFDSLGDRGILLDLPSQTEDHWSDDFSREDNSILALDTAPQNIEFGSAEQSCTIPRKSNVWSEAASAESVEMLLNSVGQDDMTTKKSEAKKAEACDTLVEFNKQMDPGSCQEDSASKISNVSHVDHGVLPDSGLINSSSSEKGALKDMPCVECTHGSHTASHYEGQGGEKLIVNDTLEKETSSPNSSLQRCSAIVRSFQQSKVEFLLDNKKCPDGVDVKCVGSQQIGGGLLGDCPLHVESVGDDASASATSNEESSEKLVGMQAVSPAMQLDASEKLLDLEKASHIRQISNNAVCQTLQETIIRDDDNAATKKIPSVQTEISNHPMVYEFVDGKGSQVVEAHYVEESGMVVRNPSLVPKVPASGNATDKTHDLSVDFSCRKVHTKSTEVISDLDSNMLPEEISDEQGGNSKVNPAIVNDFSELLARNSPRSPEPKDHSGTGLHSLRSFSEDASQKSYDAPVVHKNESGSLSIVVSKADVVSDLGFMVGSSPHGLARKDTGQARMIVLDVHTFESLVSEAKCLSSACLNEDVGQTRSKSDGVISVSASDCSEGTLHQATDGGIASNREDSEEKEGISHLLGSGETCNQDMVLDMRVDDECQSVNKGDLASVSEKHAQSTGAVPNLVMGHSPASLQYSISDIQHSELKVSEAKEATCQKTLKSSDCSASFVEQTDSSAVSEVSLRKSEFSAVPVTDKPHGKDEQLEQPFVSFASPMSIMCSSKDQTSEVDIQFSKENGCQNCSPSTDTTSCSTARPALVTLANSSESVLKEASSDDMKPMPTPNSVDALNYVEGSSCKSEFLKSDDNAFKVDNDGGIVADCGSPTIISCSEPHTSEAEHHESEKQSLPQDSVSGNVPGASASIASQSDGTKATNQNSGISDTPESDRSFTFEVGNLAGSSVNEKTDTGWKPFPSIEPIELFQTNPKGPAEGISHGNHQACDEKKISEASKNPGKSKGRTRSGGGTERATTSKRKPRKETSSSTIGNEKYAGNVSASPSKMLLSSPIQVEETQKLAYVEGSTTKPYSITAIQASSPSILNGLASSTLALFQQPFTDVQQLQLRAQIFVYGSLIQGAAPDEACMASAFGDAGKDGRSMWENVWRMAVERTHSQKSLPISPDISPIVHSGMRVTEQASRTNSGQGKSTVVSSGRNASKGSPAALLNPAVSLPSPMWSMTASSRDAVQASSIARASLVDPHPTFAPYHLYSSPQIRPLTGHPSSWPSQVSSPVPWILSPHTSGLDAGSQYAAFSMPDTVQVTPVRDHAVVSSVSVTPSVQVVTSSPLPSTVSSVVAPASIAIDVKNTASASGRQAAEQKPRKRRKSVPSQDNQLLNVQETQTGSVSPAMITNYASAPISLTVPTTPTAAVSACKVTSGTPVSPTPATLPTLNYHILSARDTEQRVIFSEETCTQVEQAKLQAEDAAALAASAARHSQELWNHLAVQKSSKLGTDVEGRLASAAAAAAAAVSVAKAAAAAAKVASDAAFQAKLMADEALTKKKTVTGGCDTNVGISEVRKGTGNVAPALILKGKVKQGSSSSAIEFAKETARKGVEAASAATKRAQNLDAIVKAAGLAAEAISQATAIVAMGDPLPLSLNQLLESGPECYWKHQHVVGGYASQPKAADLGLPLNRDAGEPNNSLNVKNSAKNNAMQGSKETNANSSRESLKELTENCQRLVNSAHENTAIVETTAIRRQKARKVSGSASTLESNRLSEFESRCASIAVQSDGPEKCMQNDTSKGNSIKQGSLVEVFSDEDGLRAVWFSAKVLEVKDGKAYMCYNDLLSDEGPGQLKEWIPLAVADGKSPRIRIAHPMTAMRFEGTRKRRRAAMGNHDWSVGDHVDVWMRDGWWEGIITEKIKEDETKVTVHFPAEGDISTVRTWSIRPSLVWKDGQWVEWSKENTGWVTEDDAPLDKRQKLDGKLKNDEQNERGEDNLSKTTKCDDTIKHQDSTLFILPASDKMFSVGKSTTEYHVPDAGRVKRTGLQKGGARVVFGVPKPGKKRKFMDVSKHYIAEQIGKGGETNNPVKLANYLIPRGYSGSRNASKVDPKNSRVPNTKSKDVKPGKLQGIQRKNRSEKDGSSISVLPPSDEAIGDQLNVQPSGSNIDNTGGENRMETVLFPDSTGVQDSNVFSSRTKSSSAVGARQALRVKHTSAGERFSSDEEKASAAAGSQRKAALAPRRSNRTIQPTSRLLEGLQSSLIAAKSSSGGLHDKGGKSSKIVPNSAKGNSHALQK